jgi:hypothetical protein
MRYIFGILRSHWNETCQSVDCITLSPTNMRSPTENVILMHFHPEWFITAINDFIREYKCSNHKIYQTPIPWVQSVVLIQYALSKLAYFRGQNNFPRLYRFIDDLLSAYFTNFFKSTIGDQLWQRPKDDRYHEGEDTKICFSLIEDILTGDQNKARLKVLVLLKRTLYKLSRTTMTYTEIWTCLNSVMFNREII